MASGTKRASPGADNAKDAFTAAHMEKLEAASKLMKNVELYLEIHTLKHLQPYFAKRRELLKGIPKFWPQAMQNHGQIALLSAHATDQEALSYLKDVWIDRDDKEPRAFKVEFHFDENPFFTNSVLTKEFQYVAPPIAADATVDEHGLTAAQADFDPDRDLKIVPGSIAWKSDDKNLVKLHPRSLNEEDDGELQEAGSFFNWFVDQSVPDLLADVIVDLFDDAGDYFMGRDDEDITDSEEEGEEDADEEIDLEQPRKKVRTGK